MARHLITPFLFLAILCLAVSVTARPRTHNNRAARTQQSSPPIKIHHRRDAAGHKHQKVLRTFPVAATDANYGGKAGKTAPGIPLSYLGGMVMTNGVNVYIIWYGNWNQPSANASSMQLLRNFIASLDPSNALTPGVNSVRGWYNTMLPYFQTSPQAYVSPKIGLAGEYVDSYSLGQGVTLTEDNVQTIVNNAFTHLPTDLDGVYFVLPSPDVHVSIQPWCDKGHGYGYSDGPRPECNGFSLNVIGGLGIYVYSET